MKVHLVRKLTIEDYVSDNSASKAPFKKWLDVINYIDWNSPGDILKTFGSADLLGGGTNRVVFDIGGNNYRMICHYVFGSKQVHLYVCWIGTHGEYDEICEKNLQYKISVY